jgi:hypothetical protein
MSENISLNDIVTTVNIIDVCTERGAFKGNEILVVGTLREKLAEFIRVNTPAETPAEQTAEADLTETD